MHRQRRAAAAVVDQRGDAEADRLHRLTGGLAQLPDRVDDHLEQVRLTQPEDRPLDAVMDVELGIEHAAQQLGAAHVDPDDAPAGHAGTICSACMSRDSDKQAPEGDRPYRVYRAGSGAEREPAARPASVRGRSAVEERPYRTYRAAPQGLRARLRGEEPLLGAADEGPARLGRARPRRGLSVKRVLLGLVGLVL